jgi:hypothetical protein
MTKTPTTSKRPTHRVYAVTKTEGNDKGFWTTIGAAWAHQDGKGFSVKLDFLPLSGAEIVIREPRAEQAPGEAD